MQKVGLKQILVVLILLGTLGFFIYYFMEHPEVGETLADTPPSALVLILGLYLLSIVAIAFITIATLVMCKIPLARLESVKLTAYSSLVNFFGPLQSGPAFRAIYLKKKHGVSLKKYASASLVYYLIYGIINLLLVASYWMGWYIVLLLVLVLSIAPFALKTRRLSNLFSQTNHKGWVYLVLATSFQVFIMGAIYMTELRTTSPSTSIHQALIYTGAANLAMFVSLTPGAIGFRESFLIFSQNLHQISNTTIVTTNILDRAMYILVLALLAVAILITHTKSSLSSEMEQ